MIKFFKRHNKKKQMKQAQKDHKQKQGVKKIDKIAQQHQLQVALSKLLVKGRKESRQTDHNYEICVNSDNHAKLVIIDTPKQQQHYFDLMKKHQITQLRFDYDYVTNSIQYALDVLDYRAFNHFLNLLVINASIDSGLPSTMHDMMQLQYSLANHAPKRYAKKLLQVRTKLNFIFYKHNLTYVTKLQQHRTQVIKHIVGDLYEDCNYSYAPMWNKTINQACKKAIHGEGKDIDVIHLARKFMTNHKDKLMSQMKNVYVHDLHAELNVQKNQNYIHKLAVRLDNVIYTDNTKAIQPVLKKLFKATDSNPDAEHAVVDATMSVFNSYKLGQLSKAVLTNFGQFFMKLDMTAIKEALKTKSYKVLNQSLITWLQGASRNQLLYNAVYKKIKHPNFFPPKNKKIAIKLVSDMLQYMNKHKKQLQATYANQLKKLHAKYDQKTSW